MNKYRILLLENGIAREVEATGYDPIQAIQSSGIAFYGSIIKIELIGQT